MKTEVEAEAAAATVAARVVMRAGGIALTGGAVVPDHGSELELVAAAKVLASLGQRVLFYRLDPILWEREKAGFEVGIVQPGHHHRTAE